MLLIFQDKRYIDIQQYSKHRTFDLDGFSVLFTLEHGQAISQPGSPFGGILMDQPKKMQEFRSFWKRCSSELRSLGAESAKIVQPPGYYPDFVPLSWLRDVGFAGKITERNQYVTLKEPIVLHPMEQRILKKSADLKIRIGHPNEIRDIHSFISLCRDYQGLEINITLEKLDQLLRVFPDRYTIVEASLGEKLVSTAIFCMPNTEIVYYYLPATHPDFKEDSPMVALLNWSYEYFRDLGFKIMDLGISSINGRDQEGLVAFKERMGALSTSRLSLLKTLNDE